MWTLRSARKLITSLQSEMMLAGWYIALAGGVLNNGKSKHDLDLVLIPMSSERQDLTEAYHVLKAHGMWRRLRVQSLHRFWREKGSDDRKHVEVWATEDDRRVDIIIPSLTC